MSQVNLKKYFEMGLNHVPCNLCGEDNTEFLTQVERFNTDSTTVICKECGLIYINPRWQDKAYSQFYANDSAKLFKDTLTPSQRFHQEHVHAGDIIGFCGSFLDKRIKILDIGASAGGVLASFRKVYNADVLGIEPTLELKNHAEKVYGLNFIAGLFEEVELNKNEYDLIICAQTLNHMLDPSNNLRKIHDLLKPEGLVFLEVQNFLEHAKRVGSKRAIQIDHLYYFTPQTLETMLRRIGFQVVRMSVTTANTAALIDPNMRFYGARMHIHILARHSTPDINVPLPDYHPIRDDAHKILGLI